MDAPDIKIVDAIRDPELGKFLDKCLAPIPHRPFRKRTRYLEGADPGGLGKEVLLLDGDAVGMIEYAPVGASGYPISGACD